MTRLFQTLNAIVGLNEIDLDTIATHVPMVGTSQHIDELERTIARHHRVSESHVLVGNSALALVRATISTIGGRIAIPAPDYFEFADYCADNLQMRRVGGFAPSNLIPSGASAVLLSNPNNPTGTCHDLRCMVDETARHGMCFVVDEAYMEFAGEAESLAKYVRHRSHVIVARTLSKCYGMLCERAAYLLGPPDLLREIRVEQPTPAARMLAQSLIDLPLDCVRRDVATRRGVLRSILSSIHATSTRSSANFVMARADRYHLCERLGAYGVKVRCLDGTPGLENSGYCRIAVGSYAQLQELERRIRM